MSLEWLVLGCLIRAGLDGIRQGLAAPPIVHGDSDALTAADREALGMRAIPASLGEALDAFIGSEIVSGWFARDFVDTFVGVKRAEIARVDALTAEQKYDAYATSY